MSVSSQHLAEGLLQVAKQYPDNLDNVVNAFLDFCKQKNISALIPHVASYMQYHLAKMQKQERVHIYTRYTPQQSLIDYICKIIGAPKHAAIHLIEDSSVIGGFVARYRNNIYEGSVSRQLERVRVLMTSPNF